MKNITIYDISGNILRNVICPASMAEIQVCSGESAIDGLFSPDTHFVDTSLNIAVEKPKKPFEDCSFDIASRSWVIAQLTDMEMAEKALSKRSLLLEQSDWTQLPDVPLATKTIWAVYRQALRDITLQPGYPQVISWPIQPT